MKPSAPWIKPSGPKLFVLLTDGEDLEKGGVRTAEALAKQGVVVFTIGVGTPAGAEIQMLNEQGKLELVRDSQRRGRAQPARRTDLAHHRPGHARRLLSARPAGGGPRQGPAWRWRT